MGRLYETWCARDDGAIGRWAAGGTSAFPSGYGKRDDPWARVWSGDFARKDAGQCIRQRGWSDGEQVGSADLDRPSAATSCYREDHDQRNPKRCYDTHAADTLVRVSDRLDSGRRAAQRFCFRQLHNEHDTSGHAPCKSERFPEPD